MSRCRDEGMNKMRDDHDWGRSLLMTTAFGVASAAAAFGAPAAAQDGDDTRPITVIGQRSTDDLVSPKATASILDTPQNIQVIPNTLIEQQGARSLTDVLNNTPGITFNAGENGFSSGVSNFSMRGFDTSANIFVDGARDSGSFSRDAFNIDSVEVFKGPAGDNGRGGAGGYINVVTKTPSLDAAYGVSASYGFDELNSDNRVRTTLDLNQPLTPNAAARLNVLYEDGGVPGRDFASRNTLGLAPSIAFGLGTDTRWLLAVQYTRQEDLPDWGIPAVFVDGMRDRDRFYTLPASLDPENFRDVFYGYASDYDDTESFVALARVEHTISSALEFSSQVRVSQTDRSSIFTLPFQVNPAVTAATAPQPAATVRTQRIGYARENDSVTWLNNLSARFSTGALRHRAAFGLEVSHEEAAALALSASSNDDTTAIGAVPNPYRPLPTPVARPAVTGSSTVSVNTIAAYAYDTIELSPQWQLTGGLRVEGYEVGIDTLGTASPAANNIDISETTWAGRIGVVYKPVEQASIYAAVGVSPQPPAAFLSTTDISREGNNGFPGAVSGMNANDAEVQESVNYELGVKWDFNDRLFATATLFRTERQNVAISGRTSAADTTTAIEGYGQQIVEGVELGLAGNVTDNWSVFAGALFMQSERDHTAQLDLYRCYADFGDFGAPNAAACNPAVYRTRGDALAFTPEFSANLWTSYAFPFGLTVGGGVRYVGESYVGRPDDAERIIPNSETNKLPDYFVANAVVSYALTDNATVRLNVDNITDEYHAVSTNWAARRVLLGAPRSYLLTLQLRY